MKNLRIKLCFLALLLAGCGLKTNLVVYDDSAPMPEISQVSYQVVDHMFRMQLDITGGSGTVLYQVDRAEVVADCKCIGNWLRYYESTASAQRIALTRHLKLRRPYVIYAFRVRAKDSLGRVSAWSKVMKTNAAHVGEAP